MAQAGLTATRARAALRAALGPLILSGMIVIPAQAQQADSPPAPDVDTPSRRADDNAPQVFEAMFFAR